MLEFGCGALSTGIWLIEYLRPGKYFGMEPVKWLFGQGGHRLGGVQGPSPRCLWASLVSLSQQWLPDPDFQRLGGVPLGPDAGKEYEVPLHMLEHKAPTLIHTPTVQPDFSGVQIAPNHVVFGAPILSSPASPHTHGYPLICAF